MRLPRPERIPVTSSGIALSGVTILLVLFFLVTTTYDTDATPLTLPVSVSDAAVEEFGAACVIIHRDMDPAGGERVAWRFSDGLEASRPIEPDGLFFEASRVADRAPDRTFLVKADADVRWAVVDDVVETLRNAGARDIVLWTARGGALEAAR